jgi:ABC-type branched-subunit amino acid transport system permease subunit
VLDLDPNTYMYFFLAFSGLVMAALGFFIMRISDSPYGRSLRAIRDDAEVAEAFGKNTVNLRLLTMMIGCAYAGIGGALTIAFVGGLNPSGWQPVETFVIFTAMLVGGRGNHWGSVLGAFLVPVLFVEATRFIPRTHANPELNAALRGIAIGLLIIATLWFRPQGLIPERKWPWRRKLGVADIESSNQLVPEPGVVKVG